jgi:hypothetical protein
MRRSAPVAVSRFEKHEIPELAAMPSVAQLNPAARSSPSYLALSVQGQLPVAVPSRGLTQQVTGQLTSLAVSCNAGKAQSALPSRQSRAAAAEYSSRNERFLASARSTASPWFSPRLQRGAGSACRVLGNLPTAGLPQVRPNPSLKLTRYGRHCKPGPRHLVHHREPGLQCPPPRAA